MTVKEARAIAQEYPVPEFGEKRLIEAFGVLMDYRDLVDALANSNIDLIETALTELEILKEPTEVKCTCELEIIVKRLDPDCTVHSLKNQKSDQNALKPNEKKLSLPASMEESSTGSKQEKS